MLRVKNMEKLFNMRILKKLESKNVILDEIRYLGNSRTQLRVGTV